MTPQRRVPAGAGFVLLPVALLLVLIATLALMANRAGPQAAADAGGEREATLARFVAEGGMAHALWRANRNACADYDLPVTDFGGHSYQVSFTPDSGSPVNMVATASTASGASASLARSDVAVHEGAASLVLQPDAAAGADTYLDAYATAADRGTELTLSAQPPAYRPLLRFDLGAIPAGATVSSARLELYQTEGGGEAGASSVDLYRVTAGWAEGSGVGQATGDGATWSTRDGVAAWRSAGGDHHGTAVASNTELDGTGWKTWDVTGLVGGWVSGAVPNHGVLLAGIGNVYSATYHSSDSSSATLRPRLTIDYHPCECGGNGASLVLVPGADGADTYIDESKNLQNFGAEQSILLGSKSKSQRGLLRFDLSWLPPAATVTAATLSLNLEKAVGGSVSAHRVTRAWGEGDGTVDGSCYTGASWLRHDACEPWAPPGGEFDPTPAASVAGGAVPGRRNWDVSALVTAQHDGTYPNHGFLLQVSSGFQGVELSSGDAVDADLHPRLVIDYHCACDVDCRPGSGS